MSRIFSRFYLLVLVGAVVASLSYAEEEKKAIDPKSVESTHVGIIFDDGSVYIVALLKKGTNVPYDSVEEGAEYELGHVLAPQLTLTQNEETIRVANGEMEVAQIIGLTAKNVRIGRTLARAVQIKLAPDVSLKDNALTFDSDKDAVFLRREHRKVEARLDVIRTNAAGAEKLLAVNGSFDPKADELEELAPAFPFVNKEFQRALWDVMEVSKIDPFRNAGQRQAIRAISIRTSQYLFIRLGQGKARNYVGVAEALSVYAYTLERLNKAKSDAEIHKLYRDAVYAIAAVKAALLAVEYPSQQELQNFQEGVIDAANLALALCATCGPNFNVRFTGLWGLVALNSIRLMVRYFQAPEVIQIPGLNRFLIKERSLERTSKVLHELLQPYQDQFEQKQKPWFEVVPAEEESLHRAFAMLFRGIELASGRRIFDLESDSFCSTRLKWR